VPTWAPFGLQFDGNGHSARARALKREGIDFAQEDNAFLRVQLRALGLIKRVADTHRYYLTRIGRAAFAAACSLTRFNIVPAMAAAR